MVASLYMVGTRISPIAISLYMVSTRISPIAISLYMVGTRISPIAISLYMVGTRISPIAISLYMTTSRGRILTLCAKQLREVPNFRLAAISVMVFIRTEPVKSPGCSRQKQGCP